jgi:two-component system, cell cycle sensor histidine kinase and response regulator CckA
MEAEMFRTLCQAAFDGVIVHDAGRVIAVNDQCARMFREPANRMIGRSILEMTDPERHGIVLQHVHDHDSRPFESMAQRTDGSRFPVEICGVSIEGSPLRLVALRDLTERKRAEHELHRREERFQALEKTAFSGVVLESGDGITEVNESFVSTFGYSNDDLRGRRFSDLIAAADDAAEPVDTTPRDARVICKDGSAIVVQVCTAETTGGERILAVRDVSLEREAQREVFESERRYRELSESTHDLICVHDIEGRIVDVNAASVRALGWPREELCAMDIRDLLTERALAVFPEYIATLTREGVAEGIMEVRARGGERRLWRYHNTLHGTGASSVVRGLARDVTDEEMALHALRRSEHHFRSIIENVSDLISVLDRTGVVRYVSPSVTRTLGFSAEELVGRVYSELIHPDDVARAGAVFAHQVTTPDAVGALDARIRHGASNWKWYSIVVTNRLVNGNVSSVIVNARDITESRLLVSQLEQANRVNGLGRLAATVAHEFNNVLMGMQPFAELIQRPGIPAAVAARGAGHIASSIARGKRVASDILRFTQPAHPTLGRVNLAQWWDQLLPEVKAGTENSISLDTAFPPLLAVVGDAGQLSQVFSNLISNARHAMPGGGRLSIVARRPEAAETFSFGVVPHAETFVQISVSDTGCGIPADVIGHVFDPLFTTRTNGGTGLGLAIVHQIIINHGGAVFVESTPGAGTTFHAFLRAAAELAAEKSAVPSAPPRLTRSARVLIIDDEYAVAEGLSALLQEEGIITAVAGTAAEGEAAAERSEPDFALIDVGLPDASGVEVAARLRARFPALKVLIMSGHASAAKALPRDPSVRFLQKPFECDALLRILKSFQEAS